MRASLPLLMLAACAEACSRQPTAEQTMLAADIEARVVLPKGAGSLKCYERYYVIASEADQKRLLNFTLPGKRVVFGSYIVGKKPGVHWVDGVEGFPDLEDAGCHKLSLVYIAGDRTFPVEAACSPTWDGNLPDVVDPPVTC